MESFAPLLALEAFIPVLLSAFGLLCLVRIIARMSNDCRALAYVGWGLVIIGNLTKAIWKLCIVFFSLDLRGLENLFYILVAPGLVCLAWATWNAFRAVGRTPVWVVPVIMITVIEGAAAIRSLSKGGRGWFYVLLAAMLCSSLAISALLFREAKARAHYTIAPLFIFYAFIISANYLLLLAEKPSLLLQGGTQVFTTLAAATLTYATWKLERALTMKSINPTITN